MGDNKIKKIVETYEKFVFELLHSQPHGSTEENFLDLNEINI
jgi:hypothetical protein